MPLEWSGIVKSGYLTKSPPADLFRTRRWQWRYFVLYDPSLVIPRTSSGSGTRFSVCDQSSSMETEATPPAKYNRNKRRKSSIITENVLKIFRDENNFDGSDVNKPTLFYFENAEKEMKGGEPRSEFSSFFVHSSIKHSLVTTASNPKYKDAGFDGN